MLQQWGGGDWCLMLQKEQQCRKQLQQAFMWVSVISVTFICQTMAECMAENCAYDSPQGSSIINFVLNRRYDQISWHIWHCILSWLLSGTSTHPSPFCRTPLTPDRSHLSCADELHRLLVCTQRSYLSSSFCETHCQKAVLVTARSCLRTLFLD